MTVPRIEIGAEVIQRERNLTGRVRAIHDCDDPVFLRATDHLLDGKYQCGWRRDVADDQDARALRHPRPDLLHHLHVVSRWQTK